MKKISILAAAALALGLGAGFAWTQAKKPVNRKCPVKPDVRIDPTIVVTYNGKTIGMCCTDCVDKWKKAPASFTANVKEDAHLPYEPESAKNLSDAIEGGKNGPYPVLLFFTDKSPASADVLKVISMPAVEEAIATKCSYAKVEFKKDSAEAKAYGVTAAPSLVFVDPVPNPPKALKTLDAKAATAAAVVKEVNDTEKKVKERK
jgi:hypothetical protein